MKGASAAFFVILCAASVTVVNLPNASSAPEGTRAGAIAGRILDQHGTPIGYAVAIILGHQIGAYADASGNFRISGVPVGTYTVQGKALGFGAKAEVVRVAADSTSELEFRLIPILMRTPELPPPRNRWPYISSAGAPPCPPVPRIPTEGWKRSRFFSEDVGFRLPRSFRRDSTARFEHGGVRWRDGQRQVDQVNGIWGERSFGEPSSTPGYAECVDTIAQVPYRVVRAYWPSYPAYASAAVPMNDGDDYREILLGMSPDSSDVALFLAIFQTLRPDSLP